MAAQVTNKEHLDKILLIDSDGFVAEALRHFLTNRSCCLKTSKTAVEALKLLYQEDFSMVLVDSSLQDMEGLALCALIHELYPALEQILFVDYQKCPNAAEACKAGIKDWIEKPFSINSAEKIIFRLLEKESAVKVSDKQMNGN